MVVCPKKIDQYVETAIALIDVIRRIRGEIREFTILFDEDTILVISEVCGAQPHRFVLLVDMALRPKAIEPTLHCSVGVQIALGRPHIEVGAEDLQDSLLLRKLPLVGKFTKFMLLRSGSQRKNLRVLRSQLGCKIEHIGAVVAVLRDWPTIRGCHDRLPEAFDLNASIIDIELCDHLGARRHEHPGKSIANSSPAGVSQM